MRSIILVVIAGILGAIAPLHQVNAQVGFVNTQIPNPSYKWSRLVQTSKGSILDIDAETLTRRGNTASFWIRVALYKSVRSLNNSSIVMIYNTVDCNRKQIQSHVGYGLSRTGKLLKTTRQEPVKPIKAGTLEHTLYSAVCN